MVTKYLHHVSPALQDYDLAKAADWDDLKACCSGATLHKITDNQCTSLPPRPADSAGSGAAGDNHDGLKGGEDNW